MMLARQALLGDVRQHRAHHSAQRRLRQYIVTNVIGGHIVERVSEAQHR